MACSDLRAGNRVQLVRRYGYLHGALLHFVHAASKLIFSHVLQRTWSTMLLARDYVGYMATEVVKRLVEGGRIETEAAPEIGRASCRERV